MPLTPQEIQTQEFHVRFRGFDVEEVDGFLAKVADEVLSLIEQNKNLTAQVESLTREMADYQSKGKAFQHAILSAQQIADDLMEKSRNEAEQLLADAHGEADEIREAANTEVAALEREVDRLESLRAEIKSELQRMLHGYLGMVDAPPAAPGRNEPAPPKKPTPARKEAEQEDDLSDLYQKIDLPAGNLDTLAAAESAFAEDMMQEPREPRVTDEDDAPYAGIPDLDGEVIFSLEDPLDANEPSVNYEDLTTKGDR
ncbi:MAG: DivIVA domain-containing protein [Desulfobulbaceae bacterium]|nr:DivIVA domain-containing protein [Desulfobulbaceae bacterium]